MEPGDGLYVTLRKNRKKEAMRWLEIWWAQVITGGQRKSENDEWNELVREKQIKDHKGVTKDGRMRLLKLEERIKHEEKWADVSVLRQDQDGRKVAKNNPDFSCHYE